MSKTDDILQKAYLCLLNLIYIVFIVGILINLSLKSKFGLISTFSVLSTVHLLYGDLHLDPDHFLPQLPLPGRTPGQGAPLDEKGQ